MLSPSRDAIFGIAILWREPMVITQTHPDPIAAWRPERALIAASWLAVGLLLAALGWSYFSHPKPGPYGVCYSNKGRNNCPPDLSKAGRFADLRLTSQPR
jgi:hypothetical protein